MEHKRGQTCVETERTRLVRRKLRELKRAPVRQCTRLLTDAAVEVENPLRLQVPAQQEIRARLLHAHDDGRVLLHRRLRTVLAHELADEVTERSV